MSKVDIQKMYKYFLSPEGQKLISRVSRITKECFSEVYEKHSFGAGNVTRTHDPFITSEVLYRLSYTSMDKSFIKR